MSKGPLVKRDGNGQAIGFFLSHCVECEAGFNKKKHHQLICSKACYRSNYAKKVSVLNVRAPDVSSGTVGAIHELLVSVDLLRRGYEVYRALSPNSSSDLVAVMAGSAIRIQVTTGKRFPNGRVFYSPHRGGGYDVIAIVEHSGQIKYEPDMLSKMEAA